MNDFFNLTPFSILSFHFNLKNDAQKTTTTTSGKQQRNIYLFTSTTVQQSLPNNVEYVGFVGIRVFLFLHAINMPKTIFPYTDIVSWLS